MCSRTVSDPANRLRKTRKKKSSAVPLFRSGHMSEICAGLGSKGKVGVQRGRETAGVPSFLPPAAGAATLPPSADGESPAEVQRKTSRPERANTLTQFAHPAQPVQEKEPPRQGEHANAVRVPRSAGAEKAPPHQGEHAHAVRVPRSAGAGKRAAPLGRTRLRQFAHPGQPVQEKEPPVRANPPAAVRVPRLSGAGKRGGRKI